MNKNAFRNAESCKTPGFSVFSESLFFIQENKIIAGFETKISMNIPKNQIQNKH